MNIKQLLCNHRKFGSRGIVDGCFADELGGPRTWHYLHFECKGCGRMSRDPSAKKRVPFFAALNRIPNPHLMG